MAPPHTNPAIHACTTARRTSFAPSSSIECCCDDIEPSLIAPTGVVYITRMIDKDRGCLVRAMQRGL